MDWILGPLWPHLPLPVRRLVRATDARHRHGPWAFTALAELAGRVADAYVRRFAPATHEGATAAYAAELHDIATELHDATQETDPGWETPPETVQRLTTELTELELEADAVREARDAEIQTEAEAYARDMFAPGDDALTTFVEVVDWCVAVFVTDAVPDLGVNFDPVAEQRWDIGAPCGDPHHREMFFASEVRGSRPLGMAIHLCRAHCPVLAQCTAKAPKLAGPGSVLAGVYWAGVGRTTHVVQASHQPTEIRCVQCRGGDQRVAS